MRKEEKERDEREKERDERKRGRRVKRGERARDERERGREKQPHTSITHHRMQQMLCAQHCCSSFAIFSATPHARLSFPLLLMFSNTISIMRPRLPEPVYTNSCENAWIAALISRVCSSSAAGFSSAG